MHRSFHKDKTVDRSHWKSGVWDEEPDYFEWDTKAGYGAFASRLEGGAWCLYIEAPHPTGDGFRPFWNALSPFPAKRSDYIISLVVKTDNPNISQFVISFERWETPLYDPISYRGKYKTLKEVIEIGEEMAKKMMQLNVRQLLK